MGARQFYWKLRGLERALLDVDKRLASTAFIVGIWGKGMIMIIDCIWLERLLPVRTFTLFFNTNQCEKLPGSKGRSKWLVASLCALLSPLKVSFRDLFYTWNSCRNRKIPERSSALATSLSASPASSLVESDASNPHWSPSRSSKECPKKKGNLLTKCLLAFHDHETAFFMEISGPYVSFFMAKFTIFTESSPPYVGISWQRKLWGVRGHLGIFRQFAWKYSKVPCTWLQVTQRRL